MLNDNMIKLLTIFDAGLQQKGLGVNGLIFGFHQISN